jgi:hypothetical protein
MVIVGYDARLLRIHAAGRHARRHIQQPYRPARPNGAGKSTLSACFSCVHIMPDEEPEHVSLCL